MDPKAFYEIGVEDQQQYYGKTFFRLLNPKTQRFDWAWCNGFISPNIAKFNIDSPSAQSIITVDLTKAQPNFTFPESGLYNYKDSTIYFTKIPTRQTKKGLCKETGRLKPFGTLFAFPRILNRRPDIELWGIRSIQEMFSDVKTYSLAEGMSVFKKKSAYSLALSRNFMLSLGITGKFLSLWYKHILIGEVRSPKEIVLLSKKNSGMFQQEVLDHFLEENVKINGLI